MKAFLTAVAYRFACLYQEALFIGILLSLGLMFWYGCEFRLGPEHEPVVRFYLNPLRDYFVPKPPKYHLVDDCRRRTKMVTGLSEYNRS